METVNTSTAPANYLGLKTELQNIAGIIEQYPDHLKQRTFELLITAYLGAAHSKESTPAQLPEVPAVENEAVEAVASVTEDERAAENTLSDTTDEQEGVTDSSDMETRINATIESSTNMLRRRIRLRTMSPMRWQTPA